MHKASSYTLCYRNLNFSGIQKHAPYKYVLVLFPIENLRQAVETVKRILTREKIDRQLGRQSSSTPFMSVKNSYNNRVTFSTQDGLEDKIDKFTTMMGKLVTRDNKVNRPFKP